MDIYGKVHIIAKSSQISPSIINLECMLFILKQ